jgi:DNA repair protein RadC
MAVVYPRDILKMALANDCSSIILSHNHPGGSLRASKEDVALTQRIVDIFKPLDINVIDHIIVGGYSFSSMAENDVLPSNKMDVANYEPIKLSVAEEEQVEYISVDEEMEL